MRPPMIGNAFGGSQMGQGGFPGQPAGMTPAPFQNGLQGQQGSPFGGGYQPTMMPQMELPQMLPPQMMQMMQSMPPQVTQQMMQMMPQMPPQMPEMTPQFMPNMRPRMRPQFRKKIPNAFERPFDEFARAPAGLLGGE